jgi:hypothetical protein
MIPRSRGRPFPKTGIPIGSGAGFFEIMIQRAGAQRRQIMVRKW